MQYVTVFNVSAVHCAMPPLKRLSCYASCLTLSKTHNCTCSDALFNNSYIVCKSCLLQGRLDVRDAASSSFLTEVAATLKDLQSLCGRDFLVYLQSSALPATKLPSNTQVSPAKTTLSDAMQ